MIRENVFLVVDFSTNLITNIVVAEPDVAKEMGFYPEYKGSAIGLEYNPPKEEEIIEPEISEESALFLSNALEDGVNNI